MSSLQEKALENRKKGYNCAQAVACVLADKVGVDEETMFKAAEGFGAGMGGMECACGAVSGAVLAAGFKSSSADLANPNSKAATQALSKQIVAEFIEKNQAVNCKDIKGVETGKVLRSCPGCIEDAVEIAEKVLEL